MGHEVLENQMRSIINSMPLGKTFFLRDIIANPPARLGRTLFEEVQSGAITNVKYLTKVDGIEQYQKM